MEGKEVKMWIGEDESAHQMLSRVFMARPFLLPPPLHKVPLRVGNVLEILGPSPSAKTHILIQTAISCILPKTWNDVEYGGLDHLVVFVDLDCHFDILRLSDMLNHRIMGADKAGNKVQDKTLYNLCMSRFLYVRCYSSFEFIQTLKTLHYRLQKEKEAHGVSSLLLMIDSIGAFHWIDRASTFLPLREKSRKNLFPQSVSEAVVQEIKKLIHVHPMLIIATKSAIFVDRYSSASSEVKWNFPKDNLQTERVSRNVIQYREYMPSVWQVKWRKIWSFWENNEEIYIGSGDSFVTHRILLRSSDLPVTSNHENCTFYTLEWLLPRLNGLERLVVKDAGIDILG